MKKFLLLCILQLGVLQAQDYFPTKPNSGNAIQKNILIRIKCIDPSFEKFTFSLFYQ